MPGAAARFGRSVSRRGSRGTLIEEVTSTMIGEASGDGNEELRLPRVLLADDHRLVADSLASLLHGHVELVGTVRDGQALLDAVRELRPDLVITDIAMPALNGLEAL